MAYNDAQTKSRDNIIVRFIKGCLTFARRAIFMIGLMVIISLTLTIITVNKLANRTAAPLPSKMLLTYTFKDAIGETAGKPSFDQPLFKPTVTTTDFVQALDRAGKDSRVIGFAADIENVQMSFAQVQELRAAIARFRTAGKFTSIYATSYGGMGAGMGDYYLASSFDEIWMQPVGLVNINGLAMEVPFLKGILDKVGVEAQFAHKGIYKSAPESLTSTGMSDPTRENMTSLVDDLSAQVLSDIATSRKLPLEQMIFLRDNSPYMDKAALEGKLVDRIGYFDEMADAAKAKVEGENTKNIDLFTYVQKTAPKTSRREMAEAMKGLVEKETAPDAPTTATAVDAAKDKADPAKAPKVAAPKIAVIVGAGEISASTGGSGFSEGGMKSDKIAAAFKAAEKNKDIVAVVFRIDSPGGSPEAAETIRRALMQVQKAGKPVIVSMGGYAASGGYWVAAPADKIVAQPGTITGSIGVFGGKLVLAGLWEKLGVSFETIASGKSAGMWSANRKFTDEEYAKYDGLLQGIYDAFIDRVSEGRHMTKEQAKSIAEGRVYTGRQAKEIGLVDELGGLDVAIASAKELAHLDLKADIPVIMYPPRRSPLQMFIQMASEGDVSMPRFNISAEELTKILTQVPEGLSQDVPRLNCCK